MQLKKFFLATGLMFAAVSAQAAIPSTIKIGLETGYPPFEFKNAEGKIVGFDIDIADAICAKLKTKCEWVEQPFDSLIPGLQARKFDLAHSSMNVTPARLKVINFSANLYAIPTQLIAKKGSDVLPDLEHLKGKKVGALQGSQQESYAKRVWGSKGVKIVSYADQNLTYADLAAGRLDAVISESPQAIDAFLTKPAGKDYQFVGPEIKDDTITNDVAIGLRKGDTELKTALDQAINELIKDGTFEKLSSKYFKPGEVKIAQPK